MPRTSLWSFNSKRQKRLWEHTTVCQDTHLSFINKRAKHPLSYDAPTQNFINGKTPTPQNQPDPTFSIVSIPSVTQTSKLQSPTRCPDMHTKSEERKQEKYVNVSHHFNTGSVCFERKKHDHIGERKKERGRVVQGTRACSTGGYISEKKKQKKILPTIDVCQSDWNEQWTKSR